MKELAGALAITTAVAVLVIGVVAIGNATSSDDAESSVTRTRPAPPRPIAPAPAATGAALGQMVATQSGCLGCHTTDGQVAVGPTWLGLLGRTTQLDDGSTVTADEAYIRESILQPSAKVVSGFQAGLMPAGYGELLTDDQLSALIDFIRTLE